MNMVKTGDSVVITIPIKNNGTEIANNIEVTVVLPTGVSYNADNPSIGSYTSGTGVWDITQLISGQEESLELTIDIDDDCELPGNVTWSITAVDEGDPLSGNDASLEIVGSDTCCQLFPCLSQDGSYDNTASGLTSENVQEAIDEVVNVLNNVNTNIAISDLTLDGDHTTTLDGNTLIIQNGDLVVPKYEAKFYPAGFEFKGADGANVTAFKVNEYLFDVYDGTSNYYLRTGYETSGRLDLPQYGDGNFVSPPLIASPNYNLAVNEDGVVMESTLYIIDNVLSLGTTTIPGTPAAGMIFADSAEDNHLKYYDGTGWFHLFQPNIGVFAALSAPDDTTVTTAGTYYPIEGTFTNTPIEKFSVQTEAYGPVIQYDGIDTLYFEIDAHASVKGNTNGITVKAAIKKNNVLVTESITTQYLKTTPEIYTMSGTSVVELSTGDNIQMVVTSDSDADVITFENITATIRPFYLH